MTRESQEALRAIITEIVRTEVASALAGVQTPKEYLTTSEAAELARTSQGTIRRWIREGKLQNHAAGKDSRLSRAELEELMKPGRYRRARNENVHLLSPEAEAARFLRETLDASRNVTSQIKRR